MDLLLIRHGECAVNTGGVIVVDPYDPPLTERGWRQARLVGRRLAQSHSEVASYRPATDMDILFCGSLLRSLQTAQCIHEEAGLTPHVLRSMYEAGYNMASRPWDTIRAEFPFVRLVEEVPDCPRDLEETPDEAGVRADAMLAWLRERYGSTDLTIGIVSHGTFNDVFLARSLGAGPCEYTRFSSGNCGIHWLEVTPGSIKLRKLNDESHIAESERS